jgi:hypothetical protein
MLLYSVDQISGSIQVTCFRIKRYGYLAVSLSVPGTAIYFILWNMQFKMHHPRHLQIHLMRTWTFTSAAGVATRCWVPGLAGGSPVFSNGRRSLHDYLYRSIRHKFRTHIYPVVVRHCRSVTVNFGAARLGKTRRVEVIPWTLFAGFSNIRFISSAETGTLDGAMISTSLRGPALTVKINGGVFYFSRYALFWGWAERQYRAFNAVCFQS